LHELLEVDERVGPARTVLSPSANQPESQVSCLGSLYHADPCRQKPESEYIHLATYVLRRCYVPLGLLKTWG
jgi:hypothetical protein